MPLPGRDEVLAPVVRVGHEAWPTVSGLCESGHRR